MQLNLYSNKEFNRGRSVLIETLWLISQWLFISSWIPGSLHRVLFLKLFGAKIGENVVIKPGLRVKFPWRLSIGNNVWIGESCWLDNLDNITVGNHCCVSQGVYICTGNHDWTSPQFALLHAPVILEDQSWLGAMSVVAPGVRVGEGAILTMGSVAVKDLAAWEIYSGNPAQAIRKRVINRDTESK